MPLPTASKICRPSELNQSFRVAYFHQMKTLPCGNCFTLLMAGAIDRQTPVTCEAFAPAQISSTVLNGTGMDVVNERASVLGRGGERTLRAMEEV